jgi:hypothetical protein
VPGDRFARARDFVYRNARLLERRLFAALFEGAPAAGVVDALRGYQNDDGGFGNGLEPDKRAPQSQPLDVRFALEILELAGADDEQLVRRACDFLATVSAPSGAVPIVLPSIADYPRAGHWGDGVFEADLNPTAGIAAYLHAHGIAHPWRDAATRYCFEELERAVPEDAHALREVLYFLEHAPERDRAEALVRAVAEALPRSRFYLADAADSSYGLTPLAFAPTPQSRWRSLFDNAQVDAHLDRVERDQQEDGGWPLTWEPPGDGARLEWRGYETVRNLLVLAAYGRLEA